MIAQALKRGTNKATRLSRLHSQLSTLPFPRLLPLLLFLLVLLLAQNFQPAMAAKQASELEFDHQNTSEWTRDRFAEVVVVRNIENARFIFLSGMGAEEEGGTPGLIRAKGDVAQQCAYAYEKIDQALKRNEANAKNIVKMTVYLTSADSIEAFSRCRNDYFKRNNARLPAETLLIISRLAWPDMLIEIDVNAIAP